MRVEAFPVRRGTLIAFGMSAVLPVREYLLLK
jgi:hypothetical protein